MQKTKTIGRIESKKQEMQQTFEKIKSNAQVVIPTEYSSQSLVSLELNGKQREKA